MNVFKHEFVLVSNGDFECTQLQREAKFKKFEYPNYLNRYINLKKVWPSVDEAQYLSAYLKEWNKVGQAKKAK